VVPGRTQLLKNLFVVRKALPLFASARIGQQTFALGGEQRLLRCTSSIDAGITESPVARPM
jgi:hypothetical protein